MRVKTPPAFFMKKKFFAFAFVLNAITICSPGQEVTTPVTRTPQESHDYFMRKSRSHKTAAWILAGTGSALLMIGTLVSLGEAYDYAYTGEESNTSAIAGIGLVVGAASIPFFIMGSKNKKRPNWP